MATAAIYSHYQFGVPGLFSGAPAFSFYEVHVSEECHISTHFIREENNWWRYVAQQGRKGQVSCRIHLPSWDRDYDFDKSYSEAKSRQPFHLWL